MIDPEVNQAIYKHNVILEFDLHDRSYPDINFLGLLLSKHQSFKNNIFLEWTLLPCEVKLDVKIKHLIKSK